MEQNKKILIGVIAAIIIISGYFGYNYYLKSKIAKDEEKLKQEAIKEPSREEIMKQFTTHSPDTNKIELTEEQKKFTKLISESLVPTKTDPERERLIKEFTSPQ